MSAALSLLDEDPYDERVPATRAAAAPLAAVPSAEGAGTAQRQAMDPDMLRDRHSIRQSLRPGGISVPLLIFSTVMASPAIFQFLVRDSITLATLAERWVLITLGCWILSEAIRIGLARMTATAEAADEQSAADKKAAEFDAYAGFDQGAGYDSGFDPTFDQGYNAGFDPGFDPAFDQGFDQGFDSGFGQTPNSGRS